MGIVGFRTPFSKLHTILIPAALQFWGFVRIRLYCSQYRVSLEGILAPEIAHQKPDLPSDSPEERRTEIQQFIRDTGS